MHSRTTRKMLSLLPGDFMEGSILEATMNLKCTFILSRSLNTLALLRLYLVFKFSKLVRGKEVGFRFRPFLKYCWEKN